MIKIFTNDKIIYLTDNQIDRKTGRTPVAIASSAEMQQKYNNFITSSQTHSEICFFNKDLDALFGYFSSQFKIIEAAGGLVKNKNNEWLFIFRNGIWDLPKGKVEKGEGIKEAAIREVEEECGISGLEIVKRIEPTYHTYLLGDKHILKKTYWFKMKSEDTSRLVPQTEEGITEVKWIAAKDFTPVMQNTYDSIKEVLSNI